MAGFIEGFENKVASSCSAMRLPCFVITGTMNQPTALEIACQALWWRCESNVLCAMNAKGISSEPFQCTSVGNVFRAECRRLKGSLMRLPRHCMNYRCERLVVSCLVGRA
ncbi:hypothetical protein O9993_03025 [Vibrio lentus]|nr:hypothetical protein [Vibrio lentus]